MGTFLISTTIFVSLLAYGAAVLCWVSGRRGTNYRRLWTVGCLFLWAHAVAAFHFHHHWSHADAVRLTAEQTEAVIGVSYGNGIWFSYFLLLIWLVDVVMMWQTSNSKSAKWSYFSYAVHAYAFFILFNGTVVFEAGAVRWGGVVGTLSIIALIAWRFRKTPMSIARPTSLKAKG